MATRPDNGEQATRKQSNGLAVATLAFGIAGLILGVLSPPALLLGLVAVVLGAGNLGRGASGSTRRAWARPSLAWSPAWSACS
jgi:uncharacterized RDD family membrane protein YckC